MSKKVSNHLYINKVCNKLVMSNIFNHTTPPPPLVRSESGTFLTYFLWWIDYKAPAKDVTSVLATSDSDYVRMRVRFLVGAFQWEYVYMGY